MMRTRAITWPGRGALPALVGLVALGPLLLVLGGCPTVDLGETPPSPARCDPGQAYYESTIWPVFLAPAAGGAKSCVAQAGCHNDASGRSALRLDASNPPDHARNYQIVTRFLLCSTPEESPLLTKPLTGDVPHAGGDLFDLNDPEVQAFLGWFP